MYVSTKNYGHERGYAVAYRQHRAESHCHFIHGYSLAFYLEFESKELDIRNWTVDFGSLKTFKDFLDYQFDHTMLVAIDDPRIEEFRAMHKSGLCQLREFEKVGCEGLSKAIYDYVNDIWIPDNGYGERVHCRVVKVSETPANSAWFEESWDEYHTRLRLETRARFRDGVKNDPLWKDASFDQIEAETETRMLRTKSIVQAINSSMVKND